MITATAMVQIIGKPQQHVEEVIENITKRIDEQGYRTQRIEVMPVEPLEGEEGLFSGLFEVDLELKNHEHLFGFIQDYNPTSIEVSDPEEFVMSLADYNGLITTVAATVQQYDQLIKEKIAESASLKQRVDLLSRNIIMLSIAHAPKRIGVISKETGISEETLKPYIALLIKYGHITLTDEVYAITKA